MEPAIGSLFSGYGGLDLAVEAVFGARTVFTCDPDPGSAAVLACRWPEAPNLLDVTSVDWSTVPNVDILVGGSPCQSVSVAGARAGMVEGATSNLWVAMREAVACLQPAMVVWENVRGVLSAKATSEAQVGPGAGRLDDTGRLRAMGRVLGDLSSLGYDAIWLGLHASAVGACHGRFRVFCLAWDPASQRVEGLRAQGVDITAAHGRARLPHGTDSGAGDAADSARGARVPSGAHSACSDKLLPTPDAYQSSRGGAQHPEERRRGGHSVGLNDVVSFLPGLAQLPLLPTPRATRGGSSSEITSLLCDGDTIAKVFGPWAPAVDRQRLSFGTSVPAPIELGPRGNPRLNPAFVEWMMGLPRGWVTDVPELQRTQQLRLLGNGVVPAQAVAALRTMLAAMEPADERGPSQRAGE